MLNAKLHLLEKLYLIYRGRSDARKGVFDRPDSDDAKYEESLFAKKADFRRLWYISPFVWRELAGFDIQRERFMVKKRFKLTVENAREAPPSGRKRFNEAIAWLNKQKSSLDGEIRMVELKRENKLQAIREHRREDFEKDEKYAHIVQMYRAQEDAARNTCRSQMESIYTVKVAVLTEQIRLIEEMKSKISAILSKRMLRIWYYYEQAQRKRPDLLVAHLARRMLEDEYNKRLTGFYWDALDEITSERDAVLTKIQIIASQGEMAQAQTEPSTSPM